MKKAFYPLPEILMSLAFVFVVGSCASLHQTIERRDTASATEMIQKGANLNQKDETGNTPLHIAAKIGNKQIVDLLLKHGASPLVKNNRGELPVHLAFSGGQEGLVQKLLIASRFPKDTDPDGNTLLHLAARHNMRGVFKELLKKGYNPGFVNHKNQTPFNLFIDSANTDALDVFCTPDMFVYIEHPFGIMSHIRKASKDFDNPELLASLKRCQNRAFPGGTEQIQAAYTRISKNHRYRYDTLRKRPEDLLLAPAEDHIGARFSSPDAGNGISVFSYLKPEKRYIGISHVKALVSDALVLSSASPFSTNDLSEITEEVIGKPLITGKIRGKKVMNAFSNYNPEALKGLFNRYYISSGTKIPYSNYTFGQLYKASFQESARKRLDLILVLSEKRDWFDRGYMEFEQQFNGEEPFFVRISSRKFIERLQKELQVENRKQLSERIHWMHSEVSFLFRRKMDGTLPVILGILQDFLDDYDPEYARKFESVRL